MDSFLIIWLCGVVVIWPAWLWISVQSRRKIGEPLVPKPPASAEFCERGASGKARGNILGNAHNCLMVTVTGTELWITPTFPFNLIAPYGFMGLEYRVSKSQILRAEMRKRIFGSAVEVEFSAPKGTRMLSLRLKKPEAFLTALGR
jgi:hypothetical protein